jgi:hypothetical protein
MRMRVRQPAPIADDFQQRKEEASRRQVMGK